MRTLFTLLASACLAGAVNIPITVVGTTQTQIIIQYTATTSAACTISLVDNNGGPVFVDPNTSLNTVADLDSGLFTGANQDLSRTKANGFYFPTLVNGLTRTVYIGGHDLILPGLDGKWYSLALQVNSKHTGTVSCNSGADTGTFTAFTANLPLGMTYAEQLVPQTGAPMGNFPNFTVDWSRTGRKTVYPDPVTGVLLQRISGGDDSFSNGMPIQPAYTQVFQTPIDRNSAWTSPANAAHDAVDTSPCAVTCDTATASTSTPNAPLFLPFTTGFAQAPNGGDDPAWTDFLVHPYGYSSSGTQHVSICVTQDSGQTCANYSPINVTLPSTNSPGSLANWAPCNSTTQCTPSSNWSAWGGMRVPFGDHDWRNLSFGGVSVSGTAVTIPSPSSPSGGGGYVYSVFNTFRAPGSKFQLTGTGCPGILTIASIQSPTQITTVESSAAATGCTYTDLSTGLRITSVDSGTIHVSVGYTLGYFSRRQGGLPASTGISLCALDKVSTASGTDCDGNTSVPVSGYLCGLPLGGTVAIYFDQDPSPAAPQGRWCLQSLGGSAASSLATANGSPFVNSTTWYNATSASGGGTVYKCVHNGTNFQEMPVDVFHGGSGDRATCTTTTITSTKINSDIQSAFPTSVAASVISKGLLPAWSFNGVIQGPNNTSFLQFETTTNGMQDGMCMVATYDPVTQNLLTAHSMFNEPPFMYGNCHFGAIGSAPYYYVTILGSNGWRGPNLYSSTYTFGGPFTSHGRVPGVWNGSAWTYNTFTITTSTVNTSPATLTLPYDLDNAPHGNPNNGAEVNCSGATGSWTAFNAELWLHYTGTSGQYTVYADSKGATPVAAPNATFSGQTITCTTMRALYALPITSYNSTTHQFSVDFSGVGGRIPSNATYVIQNADPVAINSNSTTVRGTYQSTIQYWAKVIDSGHVQIYTNSDLASNHLLDDTTAASYNNFYMSLASTCPAQSATSLPTSMLADTTAWDGSGNPKVRCLTIQSYSPCSDYPSTGEASAYGCSVPSLSADSMMHDWSVTDGVGDTTYPQSQGNDAEVMYVLSGVTHTTPECSSGLCTFVAVRDYEDSSAVNNYGWNHAPGFSGTANQHAPGWTMRAESALEFGYANGSTTPVTFGEISNLGSHVDFTTGTGSNTFTTAVGPGPQQTDSCTNCSFTQLANVTTSTINYIPTFQATGYTYSAPGWYALARLWPPDAPSTETTVANGSSAPRWGTSWMQYEQQNGNFSQLGTTLLDHTPATVSSTAHVYKVTPANTPLNVKIAPISAVDSVGRFYRDISPGPIDDTSTDAFCVAIVANQCRTGSSVGDIFLSPTSAYYTDGHCYVNHNVLSAPCIFGLPPWESYGIQFQQYPIDNTGRLLRRITSGFGIWFSGYAFQKLNNTPDGKWGLFYMNPPQKHTYASSGSGEADYWAIKFPPWPAPDNVVRNQYVNYPVAVPGSTGDQVRIEFGYGENADPTSHLWCTSRQETCWTASTATASNPFVFDSEGQAKTACDSGCMVNIPAIPGPCDSGCMVNIPAIPGRILFYRIERTNGSVVTVGGLQSAIP